MNPHRIFLWAPEFGAGHGGIQQYTREVVRALVEIVGPQNVLGLSYGPASHDFDGATMVGCLSVGTVPRALRGAAFVARAMREAARFRPALILSTFPRFAPAGWACRQRLGIPFLTAAHGVEIWGRQPLVYRRSLASADRVLAVSEHTALRLRNENGISRVSVLPNCVDGDRFTPGPRDAALAAKLEVSGPVLLTLARLDASERAKGVDVVLRALPAIRRAIPDLVYVIAGDGSDRPRLETIAREEKVWESVRFVGRVSDEDLPALYRLCDAFVMPSSKEGFGIVFLEALATGRPVIAGNRDGSTDPLRGGELGWLVDTESRDAVARAVVEAILGGDQTEPRRESSFLRESVLRHFGRTVFRERIRDEMASVLGQ